jgi:hypothetical protein
MPNITISHFARLASPYLIPFSVQFAPTFNFGFVCSIIIPMKPAHIASLSLTAFATICWRASEVIRFRSPAAFCPLGATFRFCSSSATARLLAGMFFPKNFQIVGKSLALIKSDAEVYSLALSQARKIAALQFRDMYENVLSARVWAYKSKTSLRIE